MSGQTPGQEEDQAAKPPERLRPTCLGKPNIWSFPTDLCALSDLFIMTHTPVIMPTRCQPHPG